MKTKKIIISAQSLFTLFILAGAHAVLAEGTGSIINPLCPSGSCVSSDPRVIIGTVIASALGVIGIVALLLFMWGGLKIMLSRGNSDEVKTGKNTMLWAVIGLVLIFSSYAITSYIIERVTSGNQSGSSPTADTPLPTGSCGDTYCVESEGEDFDTCPADCLGAPYTSPLPTGSCGDGICVESDLEDFDTCPADCLGAPYTSPLPTGSCGDGICVESDLEDFDTCPADCL